MVSYCLCSSPLDAFNSLNSQISHPALCLHLAPTQQRSPMALIIRANQILTNHNTLKDKLSNSPTPIPMDKAKIARANINKVIKIKVKLTNYSSNIKEKERESYKERERERVNSLIHFHFSVFILQIKRERETESLKDYIAKGAKWVSKPPNPLTWSCKREKERKV